MKKADIYHLPRVGHCGKLSPIGEPGLSGIPLLESHNSVLTQPQAGRNHSWVYVLTIDVAIFPHSQKQSQEKRVIRTFLWA